MDPSDEYKPLDNRDVFGPDYDEHGLPLEPLSSNTNDPGSGAGTHDDQDVGEDGQMTSVPDEVVCVSTPSRLLHHEISSTTPSLVYLPQLRCLHTTSPTRADIYNGLTFASYNPEPLSRSCHSP